MESKPFYILLFSVFIILGLSTKSTAQRMNFMYAEGLYTFENGKPELVTYPVYLDNKEYSIP